MKKLVTVLISGAFIVPAAHAQVSDVTECLAIEDIDARVACYDDYARAVQQGKAQPAPQPAPAAAQPAPMPAPDPVVTAEESFGARGTPQDVEPPAEERGRSRFLQALDLFGAPRLEEDYLDEIASEIASHEFLADGSLRVTLANGHIWRQLSSDTNRLVKVTGFGSPPRDSKFESVVIKRESLGSFRMYVEPLGKNMKVRRVE